MADQSSYISLHNGESALPFPPFFFLIPPLFSRCRRSASTPSSGSPSTSIRMPRTDFSPFLLPQACHTKPLFSAMNNHQITGFSFDAREAMKFNVTPKLGHYSSNGQIVIPQISPLTSISRPSVHFASDANLNNGSSVNTEQSPPATIQLEDQPSWVDDLLDEPESPVNKSLHRRSRSDSVTSLERDSRPKSNYYKELLHNSWAPSFGPSTSANDQKLVQKNDIVSKISGLSLSHQEQNLAFPIAGVSGTQNTEGFDLGDENWHNSSYAASESKVADFKRAKQHNARRSRVRKVQYIADLERSIQVLHAEGSLVSAELEFLDHQNLILNMENRTLKQRLESLSQVQVIKSLEQEVLEREMVRLQYLYHQQNIFQQQLPNYPMPRRVRSCNDFESQFPNHSLRPKEANSSNNGL